MTEIDKHGRSSVNILLIGNKSDLNSSRAVKTERAKVCLKYFVILTTGVCLSFKYKLRNLQNQ
jgi:hypothetical protein